MNHLDRLNRLSDAVCNEYADDPRIEAIIIVGSVARGAVDAVSDIDIMLYLNEYFSEDEVSDEQERARASGGGIYGADPNDGFGVWRCMEGVKVDLGFNMIPNMEELLTEVLEKHTLENDMHLIVDGIQHSKILYGENVIGGWKERMNNFPDDLGKKMIREHLRISPLWVARDMCANRDEPVWLPELMLEYVRRGLWVLCGLNRRYYPGKLKGFPHVAETLTIKPENYRERVESLFVVSPADALRTLSGLVSDLYDLVDEHKPEIETEPARAWFLGDVVCSR